ncbi:MAG: hypothetical protein K0R05_3625, partial [Anaerocolumna sp.]|nr:hypothetical protein [Anaerocolumna sp.]
MHFNWQRFENVLKKLAIGHAGYELDEV